jgi:hypothetical protein
MVVLKYLNKLAIRGKNMSARGGTGPSATPCVDNGADIAEVQEWRRMPPFRQ